MASQKRTMLKRVAELRVRGADFVDRTYSAMPHAFVERMQQGQPQGSELAQQWEERCWRCGRGGASCTG